MPSREEKLKAIIPHASYDTFRRVLDRHDLRDFESADDGHTRTALLEWKAQDRAYSQALSHLETIAALGRGLMEFDEQDEERAVTVDGEEFATKDELEQRVAESVLSVEVRSGWYSPGSDPSDREADEFKILLSTGGPACQITGDLNYGQPDGWELQYQDWFEPWTKLPLDVTHPVRESVERWLQCFYFED